MSGVFCKEEGCERLYRTWKRNAAATGPSKSGVPIDINMSNINPVDGVPATKTEDSENRREALDTKQETTFSGDFPSNNRLSSSKEDDTIWTSSDLREHTLQTMVRLPKPVLDSKGGAQPANIVTLPESPFVPGIPSRIKSTSVSSDAVSSTSSNYVSDNDSNIDLEGSGDRDKERSRNSSSSTGISSLTSNSATLLAQDSWVSSDKPLFVNENTDSALDTEEVYVINDFANEVQPLLHSEFENVLVTSNQGNKSEFTQIQTIDLSKTCLDTNAVTCLQPNEVSFMSSQTEKENQNPFLKPAVAIQSSTDQRSYQAPLSERPSANETVKNNLQPSLKQNTLLSQKTTHHTKQESGEPLLQVLVPVFKKTTVKCNGNETSKKNANMRKKHSSASNPISSTHLHNNDLLISIDHSKEASTTIHYMPGSDSSQKSIKVPNSKHSPSTQLTSSSKEKNLYVFESYLQSSPQPQHNQGYDPQVQPNSVFVYGKKQFSKNEQAAMPESLNINPSHEPSAVQNGKCTLPSLGGYHTGHQNINSNLLHDPLYIVENHPRSDCIENTNHFATMPNTSSAVYQNSPCDNYVTKSEFQINPFPNNLPQNNSSPDQSNLQGDIQGRQSIPHPFVTVMDPYKFPSIYHFGYTPSLAVPLYYGGISNAGRAIIKDDAPNSEVYRLHHLLPYLHPCITSHVPQRQYSIPTPAAKTESSLPYPLHDANVHRERLRCTNDFETTSRQSANPENYLPSTNQFQTLVRETSLAKCEAPLQQEQRAHYEPQQQSNPTNFDLDVVAMQNDHSARGTRITNNKLVNSIVVAMSPMRDGPEVCHSQADSSSYSVEEICEQPSERATSSDASELSNMGCCGMQVNNVRTNDQNGPVPTVVADKRSSLPSSIHSGPRESNSMNSQLPIFKDGHNFPRNHPSRCYQSLCIVSSIINPVLGLVSLLLLYLSTRAFKRQRYVRSSHLQLAAIILSTCGIFITLNILFLLCVPWAVKMNSSVEVIGGKSESLTKPVNRTERCLKRMMDPFLNDYDFDKKTYCAVVWNLKLKNALVAHLKKDRIRELELQKKHGALERKLNKYNEIFGLLEDDDETESSTTNSTEVYIKSPIEDVAIFNATKVSYGTNSSSNSTKAKKGKKN